MRTTYLNGFHNSGNHHKSIGPEFYITDAVPHEYRGFLIYERMPTAGKFKYGEIDTVIGGLAIMTSCTVQGAKYRIDQLLASNGEDRALAKMKTAGIEPPKPTGADLDHAMRVATAAAEKVADAERPNTGQQSQTFDLFHQP